ncbi:MAG TPA: ABC transporter substrate-binding protein [Acidimicrobiia bacterium]|nr:ABC transporter substrate-binding protein [Acidimicrobiia bacterium]
MRAKSRWLALLLVLGLVLVACGGDSGTTDTTAATTTTEAPGDTTATTEAPDDDDEEAPMEIATDFGVDLDAGVIRVGMLSDLTGPFGPLVSAIVAGAQAYWDDVNANGGIEGLQVELVVRDTVYVVDNHIQFYNEIKDDVVALGHSTGSPHTVALNADLIADGMLAIPLTWYSGWSDSSMNSNLLSHGTPYCIEAMNTIGYLTTEHLDGASTIAIASLPGDYGQDSAAGAKLAAEAAGLEIVYDGEGAIIPTDESAITSVANGIADSGADIAWVATTPGTFSAIFGQALAAGYQGTWSGPSPSYSPAYVAPDSPIKDAIAASFVGGTYTASWVDSPQWHDLILDAGLPVSDYYFEGIIEAKILEAALRQAYANGDMTRQGVLDAAKSLESVTFDGLGPDESYVGADNDRLQRQGYIYVPDPEGLAAGTSGGRVDVASLYTSDLAANYEFTGACYTLAG